MEGETAQKPLNKDQTWGPILGSMLVMFVITTFWVSGDGERLGWLEGWLPYAFFIAAAVCAFYVITLYLQHRPAGKPRLGVGFRLLIVVTAFWMVIGSTGIWIWAASMSHIDPNEVERSCLYFAEKSAQPPASAVAECYRQRDDASAANDVRRKGLWQQSVVAAATLAVIAWALIAIIFGSVRWIMAGRGKRETP